jgi:hypothetical protein
MPESEWVSIIDVLDRLGGHDLDTMKHLARELLRQKLYAKAYIDMPIGTGRPQPELPTGMLAVPVATVRVEIPWDEWGGVHFAPVVIDGQTVGNAMWFRQTPFYRIEIRERDVAALVGVPRHGGRPLSEGGERLLNWLTNTVPPANRYQKRGRAGQLWRTYEQECHAAGRELGITKDHAVRFIINPFLNQPSNIIGFPNSTK